MPTHYDIPNSVALDQSFRVSTQMVCQNNKTIVSNTALSDWSL